MPDYFWSRAKHCIWKCIEIIWGSLPPEMIYFCFRQATLLLTHHSNSIRMRWFVTGLQTLWKLFIFNSLIPGIQSCCFSASNWGGLPGLLVLGKPWFKMSVASLPRSGDNSDRFPDTQLLWKSVITPNPPQPRQMLFQMLGSPPWISYFSVS